MFGATSNPWFDRSILLTSATEGVGPDMARALVARGARPVAVGRGAAALADLSEELGGISWLADDPFAPDRVLPIARWLADAHPRLGGFIGALPWGPGEGPVLAPLALLALTGGLGPEAPVGLVLPDAASARRLAGLASRLQDLRWHIGARSGLTAILVPPGLSGAPDGMRMRAAGRILDGLAARKASVRITLPETRARARPALAQA